MAPAFGEHLLSVGTFCPPSSVLSLSSPCLMAEGCRWPHSCGGHGGCSRGGHVRGGCIDFEVVVLRSRIPLPGCCCVSHCLFASFKTQVVVAATMKRWWFRVARVLFALGVGIHLKILLLAGNHSTRIFTEKEEYESGLISEIIPSDTTTTTRGTIIKNNTTSNKGNEEIETGKPDIALHNRAILVDDMDTVKERMLLVFKQLPFLYKLVGDIGSAKPFLAGKGTPWQRVYYHAETKGDSLSLHERAGRRKRYDSSRVVTT